MVQVTDQNLEEFRQTRINQDKEYEESLAIDIQKVYKWNDFKLIQVHVYLFRQNMLTKSKSFMK